MKHRQLPRRVRVMLGAAACVAFVVACTTDQYGNKAIGTQAGPVKGLADLHLHQFGGDGFGRAAIITDVDGNDTEIFGEDCQTPDSAFIFANLVSVLKWQDNGQACVPAADNVWGQQSLTTMLKRAYDGGLRLIVMLAVNNGGLCRTLGAQFDCDDRSNGDRQIKNALNLEKKIDAEAGGPGKGWYRIVRTAEEANDAIFFGKMAVVLGIELDQPVCQADQSPWYKTTCSTSDVAADVAHWWDLGVRHFFTVHFYDNALAGYAPGNVLNDGSLTALGPLVGGGLLAGPSKTWDCWAYGYHSNRDCNDRGLTPLGETYVSNLMSRGAVIDADHLSYKARRRLVEMSLNRTLPYPLASSHSSLIEVPIVGDTNEGAMNWVDRTDLAKTGSVFAPILNQPNLGDVEMDVVGNVAPNLCSGSLDTWVQAYKYQLDRMPRQELGGFGSDFNGFASWPHGRMQDGCPPPDPATVVTYPFTSVWDVSKTFDRSAYDFPRVGSVTFDLNTDGFVHIGMVPDFIEQIRKYGLPTDPLFDTAANYIQMWFDAEKSAGVVDPTATLWPADTVPPSATPAPADTSVPPSP